jgi:hypothetical protein
MLFVVYEKMEKRKRELELCTHGVRMDLRFLCLCSCHEHKLVSLSGVNALGLPDNWFWRVGSIARRFYCLEVSPKGSSLERFPTLSKYIYIYIYIYIYTLVY